MSTKPGVYRIVIRNAWVAQAQDVVRSLGSATGGDDSDVLEDQEVRR
jgi:hypothetical protein